MLVSVLSGYVERCVAAVRSENRAMYTKGKRRIFLDFWIFYVRVKRVRVKRVRVKRYGTRTR